MKKAITTLLILVVFCSVVWADLGDDLIQAAEEGDLADVERQLEAGVDVNWQNDRGVTALMGVAYTEIVELLINAGADVNVKNNNAWTALGLACWFSYTEIAELLIDAGAVR
jgi:hypothetical protein